MVVHAINFRALVEGMELLDFELLRSPEDPGIPDMMCVQHVAEEGETALRKLVSMLLKFFYELLVEVMMIPEHLFKHLFHGISFLRQ